MILVLLMGAFGVSAQDDVPEGDVKIGFISPLTGDAASIGQDQLNWARLAVQDFNEETGWDVEIVEVDSELEPATATTAVETILTDEAVFGAIGPAGSQVTDAVAPQFVDADMVHISSASTDPALTLDRDYPTFFRVVPTDAAQGPLVAEYIYNELGAENLFIVDDQTTYAIGLGDQAANRFEELGGTIVDRQSITQEDTDFSALVTRIANSDADALFFPGQLASQGALMATQMLEQGLVIGEDIEYFAADGFFVVDEFINEAAGATAGAYVTSFPDIRVVEESADLLERYNEEFESSLTSFGPPTYIATRVLLEAMQRDYEADGELTRTGTLEEVGATEFESSILGVPVSFDENGDVVGINFFVYQVGDGEFVLQDLPMMEEDDMDDMDDMEATEEAMDDEDMDSEEDDSDE
jgi:branched-chain amino acid transport system substrate-binding protein